MEKVKPPTINQSMKDVTHPVALTPAMAIVRTKNQAIQEVIVLGKEKV